uniref:Uncharacterized protein n=1 Tax=Timema monikensis TaxID=170555 RepID=A0A7R9EGI3_9NEOP|nr:unnamed protein product [Timema monikensis]
MGDPLTLTTNFFLLGAGSFLVPGFFIASSGGLPPDSDANSFLLLHGVSIRTAVSCELSVSTKEVVLEKCTHICVKREREIGGGNTFLGKPLSVHPTGIEPQSPSPWQLSITRESVLDRAAIDAVHPTGIEPQSPSPWQLSITRESVLDRAAIDAGMVTSPAVVYITEVGTPSLRGSLISSCPTLASLETQTTSDGELLLPYGNPPPSRRDHRHGTILIDISRCVELKKKNV